MGIALGNATGGIALYQETFHHILSNLEDLISIQALGLSSEDYPLLLRLQHDLHAEIKPRSKTI